MDTKEIIEAWINQGYGDDCFWEGWPECPTPEDDLTPKMVAAELATLRAEVERLKQCVKDQVSDNAIAFSDGWNAALEEAAHLIECDGDALGGKNGAANAIRGLKTKDQTNDL